MFFISIKERVLLTPRIQEATSGTDNNLSLQTIYIFASQWFTIHSAQASTQVELGANLATFDNSYILD